jgi:DNA polymerase-1
VNSPKQLAVVLFEKLKLPVVRKTKTGFSTDEEVLQKLSSQHPLPAKMLAYRELAKLKSTYIDGLLAQVRDSGRVHTRFNQAVAATGRLSSSEPNLQNIPIRSDYGRQIRRAFVPAAGCVFLSADYSQIDLRVLAHVSGDPALVSAFQRGEDIHAATARDIFHLGSTSAVTEEQRRVAKSVNFGIVYGQTGFGLAQQLGIPMGQAQSYINAYLERYAGVKRWMERIIDEARRDGFVTTLLNRRRYLPEIAAANAAVRGFAERTAMNTPIQGTSADIIKVAMRNVAGLLTERGWKTRVLLQVHDDLLFEVPSGELAEAAELLQKVMEDAVALDVPIRVDLKTGANWAEMKRYDPVNLERSSGSDA